jgi:hypothetical protein
MIKGWQFLGLVLSVVLLTTGCTHTQLQKNTVNQAETLSDIYTQQVLDNLAMFVYAPHSMPQFAFPESGTTDVTDSTRGEAGLGWSRLSSGLIAGALITGSANIGANASRQFREAWTMSPIRDPHKLALMRCAYQHAVASCNFGVASENCPDCEKLLADFHAHDASRGQLDADCIMNLSESPWFGTGSKGDIPHDCDCIYVGRYCGQYVWVLPEHREKLTQLTLAILDYAVNEPPEPVQKDVEVTVVRNKNDQITSTTRTEKFKEDVKVRGQTIYRRPRRTGAPGGELRRLQLQLQQLQ